MYFIAAIRQCFTDICMAINRKLYMNVLLVSATALEIRPFLQWLQQAGSAIKNPPDVLIG